MDKNAIKKYAVWARDELIKRVSQRAGKYGISGDGAGDPDAESVNGNLLTPSEKRQRRALIHRIREKGYEQVVEEAAYTWFNRFAALRFMEVNGYLPSHVRVFTDEKGAFNPQILSEAIHLELDGLDMGRVYELENAETREELYKYLLTVQCNALNGILPGMFQKLDDYTELLFPDNLLREGSVAGQMISLIPEEDWRDQVQIIGWLYQYYNTEPKDKVFADLKQNIKISKEKIPAATQLFTPDWIVRYMVENSLGRLWVEGHPNDALKSGWKYYIEEAEQEPEVQAQLAEIRKGYAALQPEEIRVIDPCMGSGHILCVFFDVLVRIYEDYGYTAREAAVKIVENNLWGLDIDERAAQLAYFAMMMKARQYDRRFFSRGIQPHVYAIRESNGISRAHMQFLGRGLSDLERNNAVNQMNGLLDEFVDAGEYGSLLQPKAYDWALLSRFVEDTTPAQQISFEEAGLDDSQAQMRRMIIQGQVLAQKYHAVVTNPPYMGSGGMNEKLSAFVKANYPETKNDMSTVCMEKTLSMCMPNGFMAMINIPVWMFLSSYEKLRNNLITHNIIVNMVHPGRGIFGSDFGTTSFVIAKKYISGYKGSYARLFEQQGEVKSIEEREETFLTGKNRFVAQQDNFAKIPGAPVAYWVSSAFICNFDKYRISDSHFSGGRNKTHNNDMYTRLWWEIADHTRWQLYDKGGDFRRWYGNHTTVVDWSESAKSEYDSHGGLYNQDYANKNGICWTLITSAKTAFRVKIAKAHYDSGAPTIFNHDFKTDLYLLGFLNSNVATEYLQIMNPTINMGNTYVLSLPDVRGEEYIQKHVKNKVATCVSLSHSDWDSFETSWDFQIHPFVRYAHEQSMLRISDCFRAWQQECENRFQTLKRNEEELNRIFIDIYGLQDELTPDVEDKDVTVRRADLSRDIRSFISYAVGCMFGRYSLDVPGLAYAGGAWDAAKYETFIPDRDGILPICDDEYFEDDIMGLFIRWVKAVYGKHTLEENLQFIADALGGRGSAREVIRGYFLNNFYADHLKVYRKRPIYWLFDSGRNNGFKCLIYMHRYQPDTIARIRTDYIHEQQSRYRTAMDDVGQRMNGASTSERVKLGKRLSALQAQAEELRLYEEKMHHLADQMIAIDLDDGVKVNYAKFQDVLAKIR
jgi:hypothetical protein